MATYESTSGLTERDRFWLRVNRCDPCWEWQGNRTRLGYGVTRFQGRRKVFAHRLAWTLAFGEIPAGAVICHRCDNPPCVRPDHLFVGTQADNLRDMDEKGRRKSNPPKGAAAVHSVLTPELATRILERHAQGAIQLDLVAEFGVSKGTIYNVLRGKHWAVRS